MANIGDEIKDYIAKIASSSVTNDDIVANMREADKKKDAEMANMSAQIKQLTAAVAKLASREKDDPNQNRGRRGDRVGKTLLMLVSGNLGMKARRLSQRSFANSTPITFLNRLKQTASVTKRKRVHYHRSYSLRKKEMEQ
jgi:hypothetical protein